MPEVGTELEKGDQLTVLESVKAVAEVYTSLTGKVTEVNTELETSPDLINDDPFGQGTKPHPPYPQQFHIEFLHLLGWLAKLEVSNAETELSDLMTEEEYNQHIKEDGM